MPDDLPALRAAGVTRVLCNRPDGEVAPEICAEAMAKAAEAAGITFAYCPLDHQSMVPAVIAENRALGADTDEVVLAYCASGTRSTIAWALGFAGETPAAEMIQAAADAGYDLRHLADILERPFR